MGRNQITEKPWKQNWCSFSLNKHKFAIMINTPNTIFYLENLPVKITGIELRLHYKV